MTHVSDPVRQWAEQRPSAPAVVTEDDVWSWAALDARVGAAAVRLADGPERVAVQAQTSTGLVVLVLAALRAGRTLVTLSTRWPPGATRAALDRLGLETLLSEGSVEAPEGIAVSDLADVVGGGEGGGAAPSIPLDRPFTVVHTSGSTGVPKAALHTVGNHVWSARGVVEALDLRPDDRWLLDLPLYHVGGLGVVVRCALAGAALAVPARGTSTAEAVRRFRPTHASLVPTQLRRLLAADADTSSLRAVLLGGSAIPADLLDEAVRLSLPVATSYGLTEMTSTVTATAPGDRDALATSGRPLPHRALRISSAGEIEVGGPTLFAGYLTAAGLNAAAAWHPTGDLGYVDADGQLVVTGRRDLQFVSGGENVQPEAVEAALLQLADVAEAVVVPVPDAEFGSRPAAFVRTASGAAPDPGRLAAALRPYVPGFAVPVAFHAWDGAGGLKPDRPALGAEAERRAVDGGGGATPSGPPSRIPTP